MATHKILPLLSFHKLPSFCFWLLGSVHKLGNTIWIHHIKGALTVHETNPQDSPVLVHQSKRERASAAIPLVLTAGEAWSKYRQFELSESSRKKLVCIRTAWKEMVTAQYKAILSFYESSNQLDRIHEFPSNYFLTCHNSRLGHTKVF